MVRCALFVIAAVCVGLPCSSTGITEGGLTNSPEEFPEFTEERRITAINLQTAVVTCQQQYNITKDDTDKLFKGEFLEDEKQSHINDFYICLISQCGVKPGTPGLINTSFYDLFVPNSMMTIQPCIEGVQGQDKMYLRFNQCIADMKLNEFNEFFSLIEPTE